MIRFKHRRAEELEEGESYYVSMTDMMVGVLFIFIIMLSYFALNYHATTASLTSAKDAQTAVLLQKATALEHHDVSLEVDHKNHIVCLPSYVLVEDSAVGDKRCFAYSSSMTGSDAAGDRTAALAGADKASFMASLDDALKTNQVEAQTSIDNGSLSFKADQLFRTTTSTLSPDGQAIVQKVAASFAGQLPCYSYGGAPSAPCTNDAKMTIVNIVSSINMDLTTPEGRAAQALALERSIVFHDALIASQPTLAKLRNKPDGQPGGQALLQVASYGQSQDDSPGGSDSGTLTIQFVVAQ